MYNMEYELQEAAIKRGLSQIELEALPGDPIWLANGQTLSKADLIVWYRLHKQIDQVDQDIQRRDLERRQKANGSHGKQRQYPKNRRANRR